MANRKLGIIFVLVLLVGLALAVFLSRQKTQVNQDASGVVNINRSQEVADKKNKDGSMGPQTVSKNFSATLSEKDLGFLTFSVTDPVVQNQDESFFPTRIPTVTGSQTAVSPKVSEKKGMQKVKSLILKIKKIEVYLAQAKNSQLEGNRWETIDMPIPMSVDLVQLINGGIVNLSKTKLASGKYTEVRVYIENASSILENGKIVNLKIEGNDAIVRVVEDFNINQEKNTTIIMDFDAQQSVSYNGKDFLLKPFVSKLLVK